MMYKDGEELDTIKDLYVIKPNNFFFSWQS